MITKELDCIWAFTEQNKDGETEVFCIHPSNEGGWCKVAIGEGCEYQRRRDEL